MIVFTEFEARFVFSLYRPLIRFKKWGTMSKPTVQSPEETPLQTSIINNANLCVRSFQQCLNDASKADKISRPLNGKLFLVQVEDQVARFSVWAANLRVFSSKRDSLDSRLRESPDVQTAIIGLLQTLTYRATTCR